MICTRTLSITTTIILSSCGWVDNTGSHHTTGVVEVSDINYQELEPTNVVEDESTNIISFEDGELIDTGIDEDEIPITEGELITIITFEVETVENCAVGGSDMMLANSNYTTYCPDSIVDCDRIDTDLWICANFADPQRADITIPVTEPVDESVVTIIPDPVTETDAGEVDATRTIVTFNPIKGTENVHPNGLAWADSYSIDGFCFIRDREHGMGDVEYDTITHGIMLVDEIQALQLTYPSYRPIEETDIIYNDIQCGHGPANDNGDEDYDGGCPGRVDLGNIGCGMVGPTWIFDFSYSIIVDDTGEQL